MTITNNSHRVHFAVHFETAGSPGLVPVDAAAWAASAAGATGFEIATEESDPTWLRGEAAVPNVDLKPRVFGARVPFKGLPEGTGGALTLRMWGSLDIHTPATQVAETGLGRLLEHALGGSSRGNHTDVGVVLSTTEITLTAVTDLAVGQIIAIAAAADPTRLHPVQITAISTNDVTYDRELPFVVLVGDLVYGAECSFPEQAALTNPEDANFSTIALYYGRGPDVWVGGGCHLALDSLTTERGQQPKLVFSAHSARAYTTGDGAPAEATFTGTVEGATASTRAIGRDTRLFLQIAGVTTDNCTPIFSSAVTVGVPVLPQETVTECNIDFPGLVGYRTEPADTIFEVVVAMSAAEVARWAAGTILTFTYLQIASVGNGWCIHAPRCFLMETPEPVLGDGTNRYTLRIQAQENDAGATEIARAKFVIGRY